MITARTPENVDTRRFKDLRRRQSLLIADR